MSDPTEIRVTDGSHDVLNIAAIDLADELLGPGLRGVVWVQGCPFDCAGCVAPSWIPFTPARSWTPAALAAALVRPGVTGLTFSGGEPMAQAGGLAATIRAARAACTAPAGLSLVCFTGYRLERLRADPPSPGVADLLAEVDVLIDGLYVARRNDGRGLRGSTNQRIHHLTGRLRPSGYDFERRARTAEVRIYADRLRLVGIPPAGLLDALEPAAPPEECAR